MQFVAELRERNLVHQFSSDELLTRLDSGRITGYVGFDPTADSLHIGSLLQLIMMRRMQLAGHRPIIVAGGGTGMIGDPSGRSEERNLLTEEVLNHNLSCIKEQLSKFVDFSDSPGGAVLVDNREWLGNLSLITLLRDVGKHFSVNQMIQKDSVRARLNEREQGISFTEFSYQLLQSYDFLQLFDRFECELQLGGSDQWGNITAGIELIRKSRRRQAFGMTLPLVTKADGTKFGKSEAGAIWLDAEKTTPYALYQFLVRSEDDMVGTYLRYFTFIDIEEISALEAELARSPEARSAHRRLAYLVTELVHGTDEARKAEEATQALYAGELVNKEESIVKMALSEAPTVKLSREVLAVGISPEELLALTPLVSSKSDARRTVSQGGAYINEARFESGTSITLADLLFDKMLVVRKGKRDYCLIEIF